MNEGNRCRKINVGEMSVKTVEIGNEQKNESVSKSEMRVEVRVEMKVEVRVEMKVEVRVEMRVKVRVEIDVEDARGKLI